MVDLSVYIQTPTAVYDDAFMPERHQVGEPYWIDPPPSQAYAALEVGVEDFTSLAGMLDRFQAAGCELIEMVLADGNSWDRYAASQWQALSDWLRANPTDPDAPALRAWFSRNRQAYLQYERRYFGWGVFVLRLIQEIAEAIEKPGS